MRPTRITIVVVAAWTILAFCTNAAPGTSGTSASWLAEVHQQIADAEYEITWQSRTAIHGLDAAWQAPNRAHNFRTYFTGRGIHLIPRDEEDPYWEWGVALVGLGRPGAVAVVEPATLQAWDNRIEYDRGGVVEGYVNDRRGLEQGFTLTTPPSTTDHDARSGLVQIELALGGTLSPSISDEGQVIDFATPRGVKVLRYAALTVRDALGRETPAHMEAFNHGGARGVRILFEDADAVYPVTVHLLATSAAWTAESDQAEALFGFSVATAGDVNGDGYSDVIVGAILYDNGESDEGRAFAYHGSASGLATTAAWTAESGQPGGQLGVSVATAGDVNGDGYSDIIVGANAYANGETQEGRAFVYHGSASGLATTADWTAESNQADAHFSRSAATAGDVNGDGYSDVIIGASYYQNGEFKEGRAFVYHGSAAGLAPTAAWTAEGDQALARFGASVSTAGDVNGDNYSDVIVGAVQYDNGENDEGRTFVYHGSAVGLAPTAAWTAESDQVGCQLGGSVATAGDVNGDGYSDVIVGAVHCANGESDEGRAFVYHGTASGLAATAAWTAESDQANAFFGHSVAPAGDFNGDGYADVIVGAYLYDNRESDEGRAFVYRGSASGLQTAAAWTAESNQADAQLGVSVATAGDVNGDGHADVIVGTIFYDNVEVNEGRAFVYHGSPSGLATAAGWSAESNQAFPDFGESVATAGDVNGDGFADVLVGARQYDNGQGDVGQAFLYLGRRSGLSTFASWTADGDHVGSRFGSSVATAGDVNGDGYSDVVVGAANHSNGENGEGGAFVYHGSSAGLATLPSWTVEGDQAGAVLGIPAATAGDVNGDGYADVIVAAQAYDNDQIGEGRVYVYHGSPTGLSSAASWMAEGNQVEAQFGVSAATAGDVNGDGYSDVIVGAIDYDNGETDEGGAFVYLGSLAGLSEGARWTAEGNQAGSQFGFSAGTAGDVNGDGYSDVIVTARWYDNGQTNEGRALVYHGSPSGLSSVASWTAESDQASSDYGWSAGTAGDVNGDGYSDVIVGAYLYDNGQNAEGTAFIHHGSASGLSMPVSSTAESDQVAAYLGISVATAGDVNGDGYSDVIVGATFYDNGQNGEGGAFLYYGSGGAGLSLAPRQRRTSEAGPIAHLGASDSLDSFRLALLGRTPFGRGRARLEWEVKALGTPFDGMGTTLGPPQDTGTDGVELMGRADGLSEATPYHWRVRLLYDPVTTPFAPQSRWLTQPWNGLQETKLRTAAVAAAEVGGLRITKAGESQITLNWNASCLATDIDYAVYEGTLGSFTSHASRFCSSGGATTMTFAPPAGSAYYLVVPLNDLREGSYGRDNDGNERPVGLDACLPQLATECK